MKAIKTTFERKRRRIRHHLKRNSGGRVRLSVFRSGKHIYAQLIDDRAHVTLASASTIDKELRETVKKPATTEAAQKVGTLLAQRALKANVKEVVFDRGGYLFHGRIKALADAARAAGLSF